MSKIYAVCFILPFHPLWQSGMMQAATYSYVVFFSVDDDSFSRFELSSDKNAQQVAYLSLGLFSGTWEGSCSKNYLP